MITTRREMKSRDRPIAGQGAQNPSKEQGELWRLWGREQKHNSALRIGGCTSCRTGKCFGRTSLYIASSVTVAEFCGSLVYRVEVHELNRHCCFW